MTLALGGQLSRYGGAVCTSLLPNGENYGNVVSDALSRAEWLRLSFSLALSRTGLSGRRPGKHKVPLPSSRFAPAASVAVVDSLIADLAVLGVAEGVRLGGHECVGERLDHRAQQIGTRRGEVVLGEDVRGRLWGAVIVLISFGFRHLEDQSVTVRLCGPHPDAAGFA